MKPTTARNPAPAPETIRELCRARGGIRLTLTMPTKVAPPETDKNPIRLRKLLTLAARKLEDAGMDAEAAGEFLQPIRDHLDHPEAWLGFDEAAAIFRDPRTTRVFSLPDRAEEAVTVADRFACKSLLPLLQRNETYHLLALERENVRLFRGDRTELVPLEAPELPRNIRAVTWVDDPEKSLQHHVGNRVSGEGVAGSVPAATFHGQGLPEDLDERQMERFFLAIRQGLDKTLPDNRSPLVVAGTEHNVGRFMAHLNGGSRPVLPWFKDPSSQSLEELHAGSWRQLAERVESRLDEELDTLRAARGRQEGTFSLEKAAVQAGQGRLAVAAVASDRVRIGICDPEQGEVRLDAAGEPSCAYDLYDFIAAETIAHGGTAITVPGEEIPGGEGVAALPRF